MTTLEKIFKLVAEKIEGERDALMSINLVRALIELEEEGVKELEGFSDLISDKTFVKLFGEGRQRYIFWIETICWRFQQLEN